MKISGATQMESLGVSPIERHIHQIEASSQNEKKGINHREGKRVD